MVEIHCDVARNEGDVSDHGERFVIEIASAACNDNCFVEIATKTTRPVIELVAASHAGSCRWE